MAKKSEAPKEKPVLIGAGGDSLLEVFAPTAPPPHPLVGLWCHKSSTDPERLKWGWNYDFQARVHSVVGEVAMLQYYSALDGGATEIKPIPLPELIGGGWRFYDTHGAWLSAAEDAGERFYRNWRAEEDQKYADRRRERMKGEASA